ncbi:MAG: HAMP domain-containing protein [Candidatus Rokubacteria bacterium]|nr:HAMP domain-containing protein [Candidatus Rokubacteria bacterium]
MGLKLRLILILAVPAVLVVGVHGLLRVRQERVQLVAEDRRNIALAARAIQIAVENALRDRQISDVRRLLAEMVEQQEAIDRIRLFDRQLRPTLVSNPLAAAERVPAEILRRVMDTGVPEGVHREAGRAPVLHYVVPLRGQSGRVEGAMEIVHLAAGIDARVRAAGQDVWVRLGVVLSVIVVLTALALQRQALQPLSRLLDGIQRLGRGEPGPPLAVERHDEIGRVAEAFNEMAAQLEAARLRLLAETERTVELEQQLRHAETLTVAGKLASALAHEVGTPLNIISGRAEFLQSTARLDEAGRKDLEVIIGQIERISKIIRSMLDTVRPQKLEIQATALGDVIDRLLSLLRHPARRRGVSLLAAIPVDLPPLAADPNQLQQLLINLILNALDATPPGGRITVTGRRDRRAGRAGVSVDVADTGPGIAEELRPRLFEPFVTSKPAGQGTGLGLAICRDIIKAHGGDIGVESRMGQGTTFTVWLPDATEASA